MNLGTIKGSLHAFETSSPYYRGPLYFWALVKLLHAALIWPYIKKLLAKKEIDLIGVQKIIRRSSHEKLRLPRWFGSQQEFLFEFSFKLDVKYMFSQIGVSTKLKSKFHKTKKANHPTFRFSGPFAKKKIYILTSGHNIKCKLSASKPLVL